MITGNNMRIQVKLKQLPPSTRLLTTVEIGPDGVDARLYAPGAGAIVCVISDLEGTFLQLFPYWESEEPNDNFKVTSDSQFSCKLTNQHKNVNGLLAWADRVRGERGFQIEMVREDRTLHLGNCRILTAENLGDRKTKLRFTTSSVTLYKSKQYA